MADEDEDLPETQPEKLALLLVQQYLEEQGYSQALLGLEKDTGMLYDDSKLKNANQLMQLVWGRLEAALANEEHGEAAAKRREEEAMLRGGCEDYAQEQAYCIDGAHPSSITCVRVWPGRDVVLTGSGDGHVRLLEFSGHVAWETRVGAGGVLCLDLITNIREKAVVAVGSMDGSLSIVDAGSGDLLAASKPHSKYLVRVLWVPNTCTCVTASHDQSLAVHRFAKSPEGEQGQDQGWTLEQLDQVPFLGPVQDVVLLQDARTLVVAVKGEPYLRLMDVQQLRASEVKVNMNERKDEHVSFTARHLALSPDGRFLLVSTDTPRLLMLRTSDWSLTRSFFATAEQFHNPVGTWHRDGQYIYVAAVGAQVWVFHVGTCKVVAKLPAHKINVRDLTYDVARNLLVTCSFDKTVKVFQQKPWRP